MHKCVVVNCPMALTLFLNLETNEPNLKAKLIKQTVVNKDTLVSDTIEIYDSPTNIIEYDLTQFTEEELAKIKKTINLFENITNLKMQNLKIKLNRTNLRLSTLNFSSIIAGLLIGLNEYYHTNLEKSYLRKIGYQLNELVPYYLIGGFKKISELTKEIDTLPKNPYQNYLLVDKNKNLILPNLSDIKKFGVVTKTFKNNFPYSDYEKLVANDYQDVKDYLTKYPEIISSLMGDTSLYLITSQNNLLLSRMNFRLKHEFPDYKIYSLQNSVGHKVLVKAL